MTSIGATSSYSSQTRVNTASDGDHESVLGLTRSTTGNTLSGIVGAQDTIQSLNDQIHDLEQNGELHDGQLDSLRTKRDDMIVAYTGNSSAAPYDVDIIARAQSNGTTYNQEIGQTNKFRTLTNLHRPADEQLPLMSRVEELPWETPAVNSRVDSLIRDEGLSVDAAIVVAMTERTPTRSIDESGTVVTHIPTLQGGWQAGFAARAGRAGPEIEVWATAETTDSNNTIITLSAGSDDVTIMQNNNGQIVVHDNTGATADRIVDPGTSDRVVILGGNGSDRITIDSSVTENMVVAGGAGDDYIFGGNGNEIIIGGDGVDLLRGGRGTDIIIGGEGDDNIQGGSGADIILGGEGGDYISGGDGNDNVQGGAGRDSLYGGYGEDIIDGDDGNDYIDGGGGRDLLNGGAGNDTVSGGQGNDRINGGRGSDTLIGASGHDVYDDSTLGDHVIRETGESRGGRFARSTVVDIDTSLGDVADFVPTGERLEFRTRVADDLETLRSLQSGQQMLSDLADIEARTGNSVTIRELNGTQREMTLPNGGVVPTENGFAYTGVGRDNWATPYGQPAAAGVDSTIFYNPSVNIPLTEASGRENVPPVVVLFHEMSHAYNQTSGTGILGVYDVPGQADQGVNNVERQAVGLSISVDHDNDPSTPEVDRPNTTGQATENDLRNELGIGDRVSYS